MECHLFSVYLLISSYQPEVLKPSFWEVPLPVFSAPRIRGILGSAVIQKKALVYSSEASDCNSVGGCQGMCTQIRFGLKFGVCWVLILTLLLF